MTKIKSRLETIFQFETFSTTTIKFQRFDLLKFTKLKRKEKKNISHIPYQTSDSFVCTRNYPTNPNKPISPKQTPKFTSIPQKTLHPPPTISSCYPLPLKICTKLEACLLIFSFSSSKNPTQISKTPSFSASTRISSAKQHKQLNVKSAHCTPLSLPFLMTLTKTSKHPLTFLISSLPSLHFTNKLKTSTALSSPIPPIFIKIGTAPHSTARFLLSTNEQIAYNAVAASLTSRPLPL